jgi:hypothetical protein
VPGDEGIELVAAILRGVRERAREERRVGLEDVPELAPRDLGLVEREDGVPALVGAARHLGGRDDQARDM